jgi:hypothetical protein
MIITFGEYRGRSVEWLVLKRPDYVKWILDQPTPTWPLADVKSEVLRLISIFDAKAILKPCGRNCLVSVSGFEAYDGNPYMLWPVCDMCDPCQNGPAPWKLSVIRTYNDALNFIKQHCDGRGSEYRLAINTIAVAKGFPERSSPARIRKFFGEDVEPDAGEAVSQLIR